MVKKTVIWDWNGTLLNDVDFCVSCMNQVLAKRGMEQLDRNKYRSIFTFPVKDYYQKAGFNFTREDFEVPAMEFIEVYYSRLDEAALFPNVMAVLEKLKKQGYNQTVLSAMEHGSLVKSLRDKNVLPYFNIANGLGDHYAHSKLEVGEQLIKQLPHQKEELLLVGDTLHDMEVAEGLGVDYVLIANGHQSKERLLKETTQVLDNLTDVFDLLD